MSNDSIQIPTDGDEVPDVRIGPEVSWREDLGQLWHHRDLYQFLVWRNIRILYKETVLGFAWAVLRPTLSMVVFSVVFGRLARMPSDGLPYPVFAYVALVPWTYFSSAVTQAAASLTASAGIVTKVYFPRLLVPLAALTAGLLDFAIAFMLIAALLLRYRLVPTVAMLWLPLPIALLVLTTVAVSIWMAALSVRYRDVRFALPFTMQWLLFAAPVAWPASLVPEPYRWLYGLYPMAGVIEGLRAAVLGRMPMPWDLLAAATLSSVVLLVSGYAYFRRVDRVLADII